MRLPNARASVLPLSWAQTQNNLGNRPQGPSAEREGRYGRGLEEAITAYRDALTERMRGARAAELGPDPKTTSATPLKVLGDREAGTARLEEAITAYRDALTETHARGACRWTGATTQNNLGTALKALGDREAGTARLEEAITAYRDALYRNACASACR